MIGQLKFAWIDFRRSLLASAFSLISQIITYSAITISISLYSASKHFLNNSINVIFYNSFRNITLLFIVVCVIIGGIVTSRSIDLKIQSQRDDIGIMKNVGGKSRWIYSYFIFNQLLTAVIMLVLGMILGMIFISVVFASFKFIVYLKFVKFIPIFISNIVIIIITYIKSHYTIVKLVGEKDFEQSSSKLSNYKSIFEFNKIMKKFGAPIKLGIKNFLRSGKILSSFIFSFFLVFSLVSFVISPLTVNETYSYHFDIRNQDYSIVIGKSDSLDFYNQSLSFHTYENISNNYYLSSLNSSFMEEIDNLNVEFQELFVTKMLVETIPYLEISGGSYELIGSNRTFYATIIGYKTNFLHEDLFVWGSNPDPSRNEVLIGDSLDRSLFENSTVEKIKFRDLSNPCPISVVDDITLLESTKQYSIKGVIIDSFASGFTIYFPINKLKQESITNGPNLILFDELNSTNFNQILTISNSYGYEIQEIQETLQENQKSYRTFSQMFNTLGIGLFAIFSFQVIVFCFLYFLSYRKDYKLLADLGIKKGKLHSINYTATILQTIPGIIFGAYFGSIIPRYFLVPHSRLTLFGLIVLASVLWFILLVSSGSFAASRRGLKKN
ncbi:MAG: hypothetical protein HGN29_10635 [Asgard group archaeon]|nr:hypothetical protein [Asgard group archaeon]